MLSAAKLNYGLSGNRPYLKGMNRGLPGVQKLLKLGRATFLSSSDGGGLQSRIALISELGHLCK